MAAGMRCGQQARLYVARDAGYRGAYRVAVLVICDIEPVLAPGHDPPKPPRARPVHLANGEVRATVADLELARQHREADLVRGPRKRIQQVAFVLAKTRLLAARRQITHGSNC